MTKHKAPDLDALVEDLDISKDDDGNLVIAKESWADLEKAIAGDPGPDPSAPHIDSSVDLDKFFANLLRTLMATINQTLEERGKTLQALQEGKLYSGVPGLAVDFANAIQALSKLDRAGLEKAKAMGPLFDLDVPEPVAKRSGEIEQDLKPTGPNLETIDPAELDLYEEIARRAKRSFYANTLTLN